MALAQHAAPVRNPHSKLPNWVYPTLVVGVLSLFVVFATWAGVAEATVKGLAESISRQLGGLTA
jgi:hypothetical protein